MEILTTFLLNNSTVFIVITVILIFALIGYFVDQNEQKKGISTIIKPKEKELNIKELSSKAQHKSLSSALTDNMNNIPQGSSEEISRTITDQPNTANNNVIGSSVINNSINNNTITDMNNQNPNGTTTQTVGFDVFKK